VVEIIQDVSTSQIGLRLVLDQSLTGIDPFCKEKSWGPKRTTSALSMGGGSGALKMS
jgi:hypothetical protein